MSVLKILTIFFTQYLLRTKKKKRKRKQKKKEDNKKKGKEKRRGEKEIKNLNRLVYKL